MIEKIIHNRLLLIVIFLIFGYLGTFPLFPKIFGFLSVFIPILIFFKTKDANQEVLICCSYITGAEVFIRMIRGFVFYETGKYTVIFLLILGILFGITKKNFPVQYILYIFLLLFGILFTNVPEGESIRNNIVFNLSGPIVLGIASVYFYNKNIPKEKLLSALFFMLLPIFSIVSFLYFRTPDLEEIVFGGAANYQTSGGFGPNQVSTIIGLGMFIITIFLLLGKKLTGYLIIDYLILIYFTYRALLTFSRGGLITGIVCMIAFAIFYLFYKKISASVFIKYFLIIGFVITAIWLYTADITNGMLNNRYTGKNASGVQKEDISSGRGEIFEIQFENFIDNPLGIGVGNGKYQRLYSLKNVTGASHNEMGRLLEEHGYIGFFLLLMLLIIPIMVFFRSNNYQRGFIIGFYLMWFLTINHSAMRIALPGFIYALSLITITNIDD